MVVSIQNAAAHFVASAKPHRGLSSMSLHKMMYAADVFYQRATGERLFEDAVTVAHSGPQYAVLLPLHKDVYTVTMWPWGNPHALPAAIQDLLSAVYQQYAVLSGPMIADIVTEFPEYRQLAAEELAGESQLVSATSEVKHG
jgi:uncharacterized phage-associated protein